MKATFMHGARIQAPLPLREPAAYAFPPGATRIGLTVKGDGPSVAAGDLHAMTGLQVGAAGAPPIVEALGKDPGFD